jgi:Holliday junction resolvase
LNKVNSVEARDQCSVVPHSYSKSKLGRDAEVVVALYMMSKGWTIQLSKGSRGPADLYASKASTLWYIQVKASRKAPRIKGLDIRRLEYLASSTGASPVVALLQPSINKIAQIPISSGMVVGGQVQNSARMENFQKFILSFYHLPNWSQLEP